MFEGIHVLDLTQSIAGPFSTQFLGALGANVVKVEPPKGDPFRRLIGGNAFSSFNLGEKQSLCVDMGRTEGREIVKDLAHRADVVVESFRPGVTEQFDLDYESVRKYNEEVVYCSISGFGQDGPYHEYPGFDPVIQAMSGIMGSTGYPDKPPARIGASVIDCGSGITAAFSIAAALFARERTGDGEYIDVSLFNVALTYMAYWISRYTATGEVPQRSGSTIQDTSVNDIYYASEDKPFYLCAINDKLFIRLCEVIDRNDLVDHEDFETPAKRTENDEALREELESEFCKWDRRELTATLAEAGVPAGPLQDVGEIAQVDEHVAQRDLLVDSFNLLQEKEVQTPELPLSLASEDIILGDRPPALGEHSDAVLQRLGYDSDDIAWLQDEGVIRSERFR
jgi:crotonobetainyl-CoA:carnitine CoA-transferase CaiB-like acyl-CoA transferase